MYSLFMCVLNIKDNVMKTLLLCVIGMLLATNISAQQMTITRFEKMENDPSASLNPVKDQQDEPCAALRVLTMERHFVFECTAGVEKVDESRPGEIWVWLPGRTRYLKISHPELGVLDYTFPINIESATVYEMKISTSHDALVRIKPTPPNATVKIDSILVPTENGVAEKKVSFGYHNYSVEDPYYLTTIANFEVKKDTTDINVNLKSNYGVLTINSDPQGASIAINGKEEGVTPFTRRLVNGTYTCMIESDFYFPIMEKIQVRGNQTINYSLQKNYGIVTINSVPESGCDVLIDGILVGQTPYTGQVRCGRHYYSIENALYYGVSGSIQVKSDTSFVFRLRPNFSDVQIKSEPEGADVLVDGKKIGVTPYIGRMGLGRHTISLNQNLYYPESRVLNLSKDTLMNIAMKPNFGYLYITSNEARSKVYIDDKYIGETPCKTKALESGSHIVKLQKNNFRDATEKVIVSDAKTETVNIELKTIGATLTISSDAKRIQTLYLDGENKGYLPQTLTYLNPGRHKVKVTASSYYPRTIRTNLVVGENERNIHLRRRPYGFVSLQFSKNVPISFSIGGGSRFGIYANVELITPKFEEIEIDGKTYSTKELFGDKLNKMTGITSGGGLSFTLIRWLYLTAGYNYIEITDDIYTINGNKFNVGAMISIRKFLLTGNIYMMKDLKLKEEGESTTDNEICFPDQRGVSLGVGFRF